ncbi:MAG: S8 family peptidase [Bacteroidota bacterium]
MQNRAPSSKWATFLIIGLLFLSPALLQGCDSFSALDEDTDFNTSPRDPAPVSTVHNKLRHPALLDGARKISPGQAGKSGSEYTNLFLALNQYEADGITPRVLNRYEVTNRILEEYGITRRVLNGYGITKRVLNEYDVTRRILNRYDVTRRILSRYDVTRRVLSRYNGQITDALLAEFNITEATLLTEGIGAAEIDDFNTMASLLAAHDVTAEAYIDALESFIQAIRLKVHIDGAHLGISIAMESVYLDSFLDEISDDHEILFAEPDIEITTSDLGFTSGQWYDNEITPWGISQINTPVPSFFEMFSVDYNRDQPVHVYILDSGAMTASWLDDLNYVEKKDFTMLFDEDEDELWEEDDAEDMSGFDPGDDGNPYDESGHGTHVAGTIGAEKNLHGVVGIAPGVKIHSLKVLTDEGRTDVTTLLAAVDYVTRAKQANPDWPIVVNMSLGVDIGTSSYNILDEAIEASIQEGVIYVAAAGNDGQNAATYSPAHVTDVITVGAYDATNTFAPFSNFGDVVDILAPGESIVSLSHIIEETHAFESILASGTSYAAPHVTGAVARYLGSNPNAHASTVANALKASAKNNVVGTPVLTTAKALDVHALLTRETAADDPANDHLPEDTGEQPSTGYVLDTFDKKAFDGNDGSQNWASNWVEIGEGDGAKKGKIEVEDSSKCADGNCLEIDTAKKERGIQRAVNLAGVSTATFSFDYRRKDLEESNLHVEISDNGGKNWTRLYTFKEGSDSSQKNRLFDISSYASADTQIRFIVKGEKGEKKVYIDNIKVSF